ADGRALHFLRWLGAPSGLPRALREHDVQRGRRTREIGVRMALGAPREGLIWMVTREARIELAIGGPIGIAAAVAATRVFEAMLFGLSKTDPLSMASAILALAGVCLAAAIVPVRRAMRVDPVVALRYE